MSKEEKNKVSGQENLKKELFEAFEKAKLTVRAKPAGAEPPTPEPDK